MPSPKPPSESSTDAPPTVSLPYTKLVIGVSFGVLVMAGIGLYTDVQSLMEALGSFDSGALPAILGLTVLNWCLRFLKWHGYLGVLGAHPMMRDSAWVFVSGFSMSVTPGKFGELLKAWLLQERASVPITTTASVVIGERLTDFLALVLLAAYGVYATGHGMTIMLIACVGSVASIIILRSESLAMRLIRTTQYIPGLTRLTARLEALYLAMAQLVAPGPLIAAIVVSIAAWGCECIGFHLVLEAFPGTHADIGTSTFIYAFATIFGAVTLLPGGLGTTEGSLVGMIHSVFAITAVQIAGAAALIIRLCTLWAAVAVGLLVLLGFRHQRPR